MNKQSMSIKCCTVPWSPPVLGFVKMVSEFGLQWQATGVEPKRSFEIGNRL